jgi:hypothetical protein
LRLGATVLGWGLASSMAMASGSWCDVVFKDIAREADVLVLTRVELVDEAPPLLHVVDVLKGEYRRAELVLTGDALNGLGLKTGDQVLVALDDNHRQISTSRSLGMCDAISVLPIRSGKLRARDRLDYDSRKGAMTLNQLRQDLLETSAAQSAAALSGD